MSGTSRDLIETTLATLRKFVPALSHPDHEVAEKNAETFNEVLDTLEQQLLNEPQTPIYNINPHMNPIAGLKEMEIPNDNGGVGVRRLSVNYEHEIVNGQEVYIPANVTEEYGTRSYALSSVAAMSGDHEGVLRMVVGRKPDPTPEEIQKNLRDAGINVDVEHAADVGAIYMALNMYKMHAQPADAVVIDTESCSLESNAAIMSVAAVPFRISSPLSVLDNIRKRNVYHSNVGLTTQFLTGSHFDKDTQGFWLSKEQKEARESLGLKEQDIKVVLQELMDFIKPIQERKGLVFFRNPKADWLWLENLCKTHGVKNVVKYNRAHNLSTWLTARLGYECTWYDVSPAHLSFINGSKHTSLWDASVDALQISTVNSITEFAYKEKPKK